MRRTSHLILVGLVCFALGAVAQRLYDAQRAPARQASIQAPTIPAPTPPPAPVVVDYREQPLWAYGFEATPQPGEKASPQAPPSRTLRANEDEGEQTRLRSLEVSPNRYSLVDVRDGSNVIDWFPGDHPPMPDIIRTGPARLGDKRRGCGSCHLPNGKGRPENAPPAGLPRAYFIRQIQDFRNGLRYSADPRKPNTPTMIDLAKAMTDEELSAAADYFAAIPWTPWIRVIETPVVPKTRIQGNLYIPVSNERSEPIGQRIIEVPENPEQAELYRNPRSGFIAYVPPGSIAKGEDLVMLGGMRIVDNKIVQGKTTACTACHGEQLMGVGGDVPPLAGRSPSYLARQIFDIQQGTRNGANVQLMKLVVTKLTNDDIVAIAAYLASRAPVTPASDVRLAWTTAGSR